MVDELHHVQRCTEEEEEVVAVRAERVVYESNGKRASTEATVQPICSNRHHNFRLK